MDTSEFLNNTHFYNGFEGEPELVLHIAEKPELSRRILPVITNRRSAFSGMNMM